jgi:hypothetical protein
MLVRKQRWRGALHGPGRYTKCLIDDSWFEFDAARKSWDVESGTSRLCRHRPVEWLHDCVCNSVRTTRLRLQILGAGRTRVSSSPDSMRTLIKPLNGNIAISQFQLMECDVDAVRGLISERAYRERKLSCTLGNETSHGHLINPSRNRACHSVAIVKSGPPLSCTMTSHRGPVSERCSQRHALGTVQ